MNNKARFRFKNGGWECKLETRTIKKIGAAAETDPARFNPGEGGESFDDSPAWWVEFWRWRKAFMLELGALFSSLLTESSSLDQAEVMLWERYFNPIMLKATSLETMKEQEKAVEGQLRKVAEEIASDINEYGDASRWYQAQKKREDSFEPDLGLAPFSEQIMK